MFVVRRKDAQKVQDLLNKNGIPSKRFESGYILERELYAEDALQEASEDKGVDDEVAELISIVYRTEYARTLTPGSDYVSARKGADEFLKEKDD